MLIYSWSIKYRKFNSFQKSIFSGGESEVCQATHIYMYITNIYHVHIHATDFSQIIGGIYVAHGYLIWAVLNIFTQLRFLWGGQSLGIELSYVFLTSWQLMVVG